MVAAPRVPASTGGARSAMPSPESTTSQWWRPTIRHVLNRLSDMGHERDRLVGYCSRLASGLIAVAVVAVSLRADVAAVAILAAVMVVVLAVTSAMLRDGRL